MSLSKKSLEVLKQIHKNKTGEILSDDDALDEGDRLINLLKIIAKEIPGDNQALNK